MRNLFRTFNSLLCPPPPPPTTSITADDFATFSQTKLEQSVTSSHLHTHRTSNQPHPLLKLPFSPSVPSPSQKYPNFSSPAILQHVLLTQSPLTFSKQSLLHSYNTSLLTGIFPTAFKQASVIPLLKKPTLNTSLLGNYRPVSLLPFVAKTRERVVFNQLSLFLSQYNKLDAKQSGFRSGHSTETALLCHWSPANCKGRFQIISPHSAGSFCCFWHCQSSDPPVHPLIAGHHWDSTSLVWILSHRQVFQGGLGRGGIQNASNGHWSSSGFSSWTPPLFHIHYITGSHHTGTWLLLSLLRWWHAALSLFSTWWSNGSCTDLRLPGGHLCMDERTSPTAHMAKTELLVFPATPTLQHDFTIQLGSSIITPSTSVRSLWWPADLQRAHCKDCSILQVCATQHQKD